MLVLSRTETESALEPDALRAALRRAMQDVSSGRSSSPPRTAAMVPDRGLMAAMPAYLPTGGLATKLVSLFPGNAGTALPTHQAVVVVFDPGSGEPVALLDGTSITTRRTAAGSALSVELLAREDAETLAVLGTGVQAQAHAEAVVRVRPVRQVRVAGRDPAHVRELCAQLESSLDLDVVPAASWSEACDGADVVCAATHAAEPVVLRELIAPGTHVTSVGFNTAGREVDSATVRDALVYVESRDAALGEPPAGSPDLRIPIDEGVLEVEDVHEIGELLLGTAPGRADEGQVTLYKSVGIAAQDVVAAHLVLCAAREQGLGSHVDLSA